MRNKLVHALSRRPSRNMRTGGSLTIPRTGLIFYAKPPGMVDSIGLSAAALWAALPVTHRSIYFSDPADDETMLDDATIITNIEASEHLNIAGGTLFGNSTQKLQYGDGAQPTESAERRLWRILFDTQFSQMLDNGEAMTDNGQPMYEVANA